MSDAERSQPDPELAPLLAALPKAIAPPSALEQRVVGATRARHGMPRAVAAAAAVVLFGAGFGVGRIVPDATTRDTSDSRYVLLLYAGADYREAPPGDAGDRVAEYRAWTRDLAQRGIAVSGERLEGDGVELQAGDAGRANAPDRADRVAGFFIINTTDRAAAERVARSCPHLRYGGRIVVQAILPT